MGAERPSHVSSQETSQSYVSSVTLISEGDEGAHGGSGGGKGGDGGEGGWKLTSKLNVPEKVPAEVVLEPPSATGSHHGAGGLGGGGGNDGEAGGDEARHSWGQVTLYFEPVKVAVIWA